MRRAEMTAGIQTALSYLPVVNLLGLLVLLGAVAIGVFSARRGGTVDTHLVAVVGGIGFSVAAVSSILYLATIW
jgi:hypothetical protein